ncbi:ABC transporter substrate-binding protein [Paenibacillaceae bacterium]|nr:ABC transporter substrate-binding protein [Paenibacillaceae bacterium]
MKEARKPAALLILLITALMLAACGGEVKNSGTDSKPVNSTDNAGQKQEEPVKEEQLAQEETAPENSATRLFKDWTGHEVEVPTNPQRVIYHGETTGDLLALGVVPVGVMKLNISGSVFEKQLNGAEDIGFPFNVEKAMTLDPDLIIFSNADAAQYEQISKVAPTVTFNTFASLEDRMHTLGKLFDKQQEAQQWLDNYNNKAKDMWAQLNEAGVGEGETASVFTLYPGNRIFAMANTGLSQVLYDEGGFKPTPPIQKALDEGQGFIEISAELLAEFAGDRVFLLTPVDPEAIKDTNELVKSNTWLSLPAVKNEQVYTFHILEAYSDAISREWILNELPKALIP